MRNKIEIYKVGNYFYNRYDENIALDKDKAGNGLIFITHHIYDILIIYRSIPVNKNSKTRTYNSFGIMLYFSCRRKKHSFYLDKFH